ncbi:MAG: alcohol dehydrogenase catalytic domain-containing protein [Caldilineaceae bacterium]
MTRAIVMHQPGDTSVLRYETVDVPAPQGTEVRVRNHAIGINFIDTYYRTALYPWPTTPLIPGSEAAGEVVAVGDAVSLVKVGDRVTYTTPVGAYAEERIIDQRHLAVLPADIAYDTAAAVTLKGLTVQYLLRQTFRVEAGQTILFHAAAGGVGLLAGAMGGVAGCDGHWHSRVRRRWRWQGVHPRDQLPQRELRQARQRDHRRRRRRCRLRLGGARHLPSVR